MLCAFFGALLCVAGCRGEHPPALSLPEGTLQELETKIGYARGPWWTQAAEVARTRLAARHILVSHERASPGSWLGTRLRPAPRTREAALRRALGISARLNGASQLFEELARAYSDDRVSGSMGGALGVLPALSVPRTMVDALGTLRHGEVSRVFETEFGFHVVQRLPVPREDELAFARIVVAYRGAPGDSSTPGGRSYEHALARLAQIQSELEGDPKQFARIARGSSDDADAARGGDRGSYRSYDRAAPGLLLELVRRLAPGQVAAPIETDAGFEILQRTALRPRLRYRISDLAFPHLDAPTRLLNVTHSRDQAREDAERTLARIAEGMPFERAASELCARPHCVASTRDEREGRGLPQIERDVLASAEGALVPHVIESAVGFHVVRRETPSHAAEPVEAVRFDLPPGRSMEQMIVEVPGPDLAHATRRAGRDAAATLSIDDPRFLVLFDELAAKFEHAAVHERLAELARARDRIRALLGDALAARVGAHVRGQLASAANAQGGSVGFQ